MLTIASEVANLRVSPPRQRFEGELTGGATTAPEAQYDMRQYGIPFFSRLIQLNTRQSLATRSVWKAFTKVLIGEPLQRSII